MIAWMYAVLAQPVTQLPTFLASPGSLHVTGDVSLGQIGIVITLVWTAAKVFFPLIARLEKVEKATSSLGTDVKETNDTIKTMQQVQVHHGGQIQRMIGQLEGQKTLRQYPRFDGDPAA